MYTETQGTVVELEGQDAILELDDGSRRVIHLTELVDVEVGTRVRIVDVGDGAPIYLWGR